MMSVHRADKEQEGQHGAKADTTITTSRRYVSSPGFLLSVADISRSMSGILRPAFDSSTAGGGQVRRGSAQGQRLADLGRQRRPPQPSDDTVSVASYQGKGKKNVSFSPEKNLVQVFEISPRPDPPLLEELEPCDIDKLIQEQQLEGFRYAYGSFSLHRFSRMAETNETTELPAMDRKHSSGNTLDRGPTNSAKGRGTTSSKTRLGGRIHKHQESPLNSASRERAPIKGILTNGSSNTPQQNNTRCTRNQFSRGGQDAKFKYTPARESRGPQLPPPGSAPRSFNIGSGTLLYTNSRNPNKTFHLKISGESITANNNRIHPSPYRQSSTSLGRPLGALRVDSAMPLGAAPPSGTAATESEPGPGGRRVQSAGPYVSPRKVYAWRAADSAKREGGTHRPGGPCISQLWNMTPRAKDVTESGCS